MPDKEQKDKYHDDDRKEDDDTEWDRDGRIASYLKRAAEKSELVPYSEPGGGGSGLLIVWEHWCRGERVIPARKPQQAHVEEVVLGLVVRVMTLPILADDNGALQLTNRGEH